MNNAMQSILRRATIEDSEKLNILTFTTHKRYESTMCKTGHNFYGISTSVDWTGKNDTAKNYVSLNMCNNSFEMPACVKFDLILSQHETHIVTARNLSKSLQLPLINLAHTMTINTWDKKDTIADINVFASKEQMRGYGFEDAEIINYCVDLDAFHVDEKIEKENYCLSVCSKWKERDLTCGFYLWEEVVGRKLEKSLLPYIVVGDNPGLSEEIRDTKELVNIYQKAGVFLNTATLTTGPLSLAEAMACGCPVVTTNIGYIAKEIIEHGVSGFIGNTPEELRKYCLLLLKDKELAKKMGTRGRKVVEEKLQEKRFVDRWNEVFKKAASMNSSNIMATTPLKIRTV